MTSAESTRQLPLRVYDADRDADRSLLGNPLRWVRWLVGDIQGLLRYRQALQNLVGSRLRVRYQRSFLGFLWAVLNPLLHLVVMAVVFSMLRNRPLRTMVIYLFSGLLPWRFFRAAIAQGSRAMITGQSLIRKVYVPKLVFPLSSLFVCTVDMIGAMTALFLLLQAIRAPVYPQFVLLPLAFLLIVTFAFGVGLVLMVANTFYRDLEHMIDVMLRGGLYLSPIFWEAREVLARGTAFKYVVIYNPVAYMLELFHHILYYGEWPPLELWVATVSLAVGALLVGYLVYKRYEDKLIFEL